MKILLPLTISIILLFAVQATNAQNANFMWAKSMGGTYSSIGNSMAIDASGNTYITGSFENTVDFDPGPDTLNLTSVGGEDFFVQKLDTLGNLLWAKSIGGVFDDHPRAISTDASGNTYITGSFENTVDFDPGPDTLNLTSVGGSDIFVQKLDASGNFMWAKSMGGITSEVANSISTDVSGNIYTTGSFQGTVDFDPGPDTLNLTSVLGGDIFVQKLDASGNLLWAKSIEGNKIGIGISIATDAVGNVCITGYFSGKADFDPGSGALYITSLKFAAIFILKLDTSGDLLWAKTMSPVGMGKGIATDSFGNIYTTGNYWGTGDFDPGLDTLNLTSVGEEDIFVQKLDASGNFIWAKSMGGTLSDMGISIAIDTSGNTYITGSFENTVDFDPGLDTLNLTSVGKKDIFVQKLDTLGNLLWAKSIGGTSSDNGHSIAIDASEDVYLAGSFQGTVDFDPGVGITNLTSAGGNIFMLKLSQDSCPDIAPIIDSVFDVNCTNLGYASAHGINGYPPYTYSWNTTPAINDSVATFSSSGIYELTVTDSRSCTKTSSVLISSPTTIPNFDLNANLLVTAFRPGVSSNIRLDAFNDGCVPTSGQLFLVLDSLVTYDSASVIPDFINGDTLIWDFTNLVYDSAHLQPQIFVTTNTSASLSDTACFNLTIAPIIGDANTTNNTKHYCFGLINSYDPNDKQVYPQGEYTPNYIVNNQLLTYTIRFQNTGSAEAINVFILDSLSSNLDVNTIRVVGKSHEPLITEVLPGNVLKFRFDNIMLPDSTSNEPASHGYVIFEVSPLFGLSNETIIENTAGIYFDYNPAVVTNTVLNTIYDCDTIPITIANSTICYGEQLIAISGMGDFNNYTWKIDSFHTATTDSLNWVADTAGTFNLKLTISNSLCSKDTVLSITVLPIPPVTIATFSPDTVCSTIGTISLPVGSPIGGSYTSTGLSGSDFDPALAGSGTHDVIYTFTDGNSCTNSDTTIITVQNCTGIDEIGNDFGILIYPNPNTGLFTIEKPSGLNKQVNIKLLDVTSKLIIEKVMPIGQQKIEMDITNYSQGIYYLQLIVGDEVFVKQILKD